MDFNSKFKSLKTDKDQIADEIMALEKRKTYYYDKNFLNSILDELCDKGIVILSKMDSDRIHDIVWDIPSILPFSIGHGISRRIVLKFSTYIEFIDYSEITREGNAAYDSENYDLCIAKYRQLLKTENPKAYVYAKLGLAYMKNYDKDTAIDYLTVATELSKKEQSDYDFTKLIASLKGMIEPENKKCSFKMTTENIQEAMDLILSGMDIDDVATNLGMNEEQKLLVCLLLARDCYALEKYTLGNQYLKIVEEAKDISSSVCSLYNEIRKNQSLYKDKIFYYNTVYCNNYDYINYYRSFGWDSCEPMYLKRR